MPTKAQLLDENKKLKEKISKEESKEICWHCNGSGQTWTYWDGDTYCRHCHGTGRL